MAAYPATYQDWLNMGYTGFQPDYEKWKRDIDVLVAIMDERISSLTSFRRSGVVNVPLLTTAVAVTFSSPILNTNYRVFFTIEGVPVAANITSSAKTVNGFTMNVNLLSTALTVGYLAIVDR